MPMSSPDAKHLTSGCGYSAGAPARWYETSVRPSVSGTSATSEAQQLLIGRLQEELGQAEAGKARRDEVARLHGELGRLHGVLKQKDEQLAKKDEQHREDMQKKGDQHREDAHKLHEEHRDDLRRKDEQISHLVRQLGGNSAFQASLASSLVKP